MQPPQKHPFEDMMAMMQAYTEQWRSQPETQQVTADTMLFWQTVMRTWMASQTPSSASVSGAEGALKEILDRLSALEKRMMALEGRLGTPNL
jgi:hypothetical protein